MTRRKPLPLSCDGNFDCPTPGHAMVTRRGNGRTSYRHVNLTAGQRATLDERRMADDYRVGPYVIAYGYPSVGLGMRRSDQRFTTPEAARAVLDADVAGLETVPDYWKEALILNADTNQVVTA